MLSNHIPAGTELSTIFISRSDCQPSYYLLSKFYTEDRLFASLQQLSLPTFCVDSKLWMHWEYFCHYIRLYPRMNIKLCEGLHKELFRMKYLSLVHFLSSLNTLSIFRRTDIINFMWFWQCHFIVIFPICSPISSNLTVRGKLYGTESVGNKWQRITSKIWKVLHFALPCTIGFCCCCC